MIFFQQEILSFVFNCKKGDLPHVFLNYFQPVYNAHSHHTRSSTCNFVLNRTKTNYGSKAIKNFGASLWNKLPEEIKHINYIKSFRKKISMHFLPYCI